MERVVIGLEDEVSGGTGVDWTIERALSKELDIRVVGVLDESASNPEGIKQMLAATWHRIQDAAPGAQVETVLADRPMLHEMLDQSDSADLLVIGSHPDPGIRDGMTPSLPISLAARSRCAVVIVPDDWEARGGPIVVGVDAEGTSYEAAAFAAREALESERELEVVHTWEPWSVAKTRTELFEHEGMLNATVERLHGEFPKLRVRGVLRETVAHEGIIASSRDAHLIVLGTHGLGHETGLVLEAIHQEIMIRGGAPLCIVPLVGAAVSATPISTGSGDWPRSDLDWRSNSRE